MTGWTIERAVVLLILVVILVFFLRSFHVI
jgi:hypothetical protein